jgi:hypothetical protein
MVPVMFTAAQKAMNCGKYVLISAGASVPGVFWNSIFTPSRVISSKSFATQGLGSISPRLPAAVFLPID